MKLTKNGWAAGIVGAMCVLGVANAVADTPATPAAPVSAPVAKMGALEVQRSEIEGVLQSMPPAARAQIKNDRGLAEKMVRGSLAQKALVQQAQAQNWAQRPEVKAQIDAATREIVFRSYLQSVSKVPDDYPSDKELTAAYDQAKSKLVTPPLYRVSQIFFPAPLGDNDAIARARKQAADVDKQAQAAGANFDSLVKKYSQDPNAKQGSDTGLIPLAQLLPEMRPVVQNLKKGGVSTPVQSSQGLHILKLVDMHPQQTASMADVHDKLRQMMRQQRQQQVAEAYLEGLVNANTVSIDGPALTAVIDGLH